MDDFNEDLVSTMQLVKKTAHDATAQHIGAGLLDKLFGTKYL